MKKRNKDEEFAFLMITCTAIIVIPIVTYIAMAMVLLSYI